MRLSTRGVTYHVGIEEPPPGSEGPESPLLLLHGFTGSTATWSPHLAALSHERRIIAVDLLGHGETDAPDDPERYRMERCTQDLVALLDQLNVGRAHLLGYSMGGRVALHLAATYPDRIGALILESASPGIEDSEGRNARKHRDDELAASIEREGVERFVDRWERLPLFASQGQLPEHVRSALRRQRLHNRPRGLSNSLRGMGTGVQQPLHHQLGRIQIPTLLVAGELDEKFAKIARLMARALPNAQAAIVPGAGHTVHLEMPKEFQQLVLGFLSANSSSMQGRVEK